MSAARVSVVIPCYNQAQFLAEALESVLEQSVAAEVIVVDDGSTDATAEVAGRYEVRLLTQVNKGLSAARNAGLAAATGDFVVFLDADDRLLPGALEGGLERLGASPECAFVAGAHRDMDAAGVPDPEVKVPKPGRDAFERMLRVNYIAMIASVMFRRSVFAQLGGFDPGLAACEDYDLYLRLTRQVKGCYHAEPVAEYRRHGLGMSRDAGLVLSRVLAVHRRQWAYVSGDARLRRAYLEGRRHWRSYYGRALVGQLRQRWQRRQLAFFVKGASQLLRHAPLVGARELLAFAGRSLGSRRLEAL